MRWSPKDIRFILTTSLQTQNDYGMLAYLEAEVMMVNKWKNMYVNMLLFLTTNLYSTCVILPHCVGKITNDFSFYLLDLPHEVQTWQDVADLGGTQIPVVQYWHLILGLQYLSQPPLDLPLPFCVASKFLVFSLHSNCRDRGWKYSVVFQSVPLVKNTVSKVPARVRIRVHLTENLFHLCLQDWGRQMGNQPGVLQ